MLPKGLKDKVIDAVDLYVTPIARAEIAIKLSMGKLSLPIPEDQFWFGFVSRLQAKELSFSSEHAALLSKMPFHHRDPFDRMIIAQCLAEGLHVATTDRIFSLYGVATVD
jgi:PIN domain nuclease of toxin-antitoxin system